MLENNVNKNQQQVAFQTLQANNAQQAPVAMEAGQINPELLKENVQDTYVANRVADTTDDPQAMLGTAAVMVPTWLAITQGMDVFAKHSRGEYENTLQYRIGKFGDDISNSSFAKSGFVTSVGNKFKAVGNFIKTKILDKTRITRAIMNTPSIPENGMAYGQWLGMEGIQHIDYSNFTDGFLSARKHPSDLDCYGATKDEIKNWTSKWEAAKGDAAKQASIIQDAEHELLVKNAKPERLADAKRLANGWNTATADGKVKILNDLKALNMGYNDYAHFQLLNTDGHKKIPEIFEANSKANPKMFTRNFGSNKSSATRFKTKIIGREVYASEYTNKWLAAFCHVDLNNPDAYNQRVKTVLQKTGNLSKLPKSKLGKFLNYYTHLLGEGATNRVAGGKVIALIQAWFLAEAIYKAGKSEGGMSEKGKVFAERFTELVAMLACMPIALQIMHRIGGIQYAGLTKDQVDTYRRHLKAHNDKAMAGGFATKDEWKTSKKALEKELKAGVKNPFVNLAKRIGRIITVGLEQIRPYDKESIGVMKDGKMTYRQGIGQKFKDLWRHPKFGLKQIAGYPMRIGIGMMLIFPFVSKLAVKGCHFIFGKPKHSLLDEGKEPEQQAATTTEIPPQLMGNPQQTIQTQNITPVQYDSQGKSTSNMLNKYQANQALAGYKNAQNYNNQNTTTTTTTTEVNNVNNPQGPVRTYVPSPVGVRIVSAEDSTAAEQAMRRADLAEQRALETLKMN